MDQRVLGRQARHHHLCMRSYQAEMLEAVILVEMALRVGHKMMAVLAMNLASKKPRSTFLIKLLWAAQTMWRCWCRSRAMPRS